MTAAWVGGPGAVAVGRSVRSGVEHREVRSLQRGLAGVGGHVVQVHVQVRRCCGLDFPATTGGLFEDHAGPQHGDDRAQDRGDHDRRGDQHGGALRGRGVDRVGLGDDRRNDRGVAGRGGRGQPGDAVTAGQLVGQQQHRATEEHDEQPEQDAEQPRLPHRPSN